jgi:predicted negative regulator of RcsB-dependent stress response
MKKMLAVIIILLFGSVGWTYGQTIKDADTQNQAMKYSSKIDELHIEIANELNQLAQVLRSNPKNAVAFFVGPMSHVENLIKERDNLKLEALNSSFAPLNG